MTASDFYETDPNDPDAPVVLDEYKTLRPGVDVSYVGPMPLDGPLTVSALHRFGGDVLAILNDGEYEVNADNLKPVT